jgi:hypothetical protein
MNAVLYSLVIQRLFKFYLQINHTLKSCLSKVAIFLYQAIIPVLYQGKRTKI